MSNVSRWCGVAVVVAVVGGGGCLAWASHASLTGYLPYKGGLELGGTPVDGSVPMVFTLENEAATQLATFTPASAVTVKGGDFAVVMGLT